jgi:orotidine-5'-phosphate decarboxylase
MHFADRLDAAIRKRGNPICVGLDPRFDQLPKALTADAIAKHGRTPKAVAEAFITFNRTLIDATADVVPVCKPQVAFYEEFGWEGMRAYAETVNYARAKGLLVISDAKRGDIGTTAQAYANAHLTGTGPLGLSGGFDADALTVNPYMGRDTLDPFLEVCAKNGRGIFVLVKTSNPGSGDLQDLKTESGKPIRDVVAGMVHELGAAHRGDCGLSDVGAVVGATYPEQAKRLRELMPDTVFLIPGYGAQGGTAADAVAGFRSDKRGAIVNNSRGLIFAYKQEPYAKQFGEADYGGAARAATVRMAEELGRALQA